MFWGAAIKQRVLLPNVYFPDRRLSPRVMMFVAGITVLAGLLAGIGPALQGARSSLSGELGAERRGSSGRRSRTRSARTVAQAALSVVLLVEAGLFVRSLQEVRKLDLGPDVDRVVMATLELETDELESREVNAIFREVARRLSAEPAIATVALTSVPFGSALADRLTVPGIDSLPRLAGGGPYYYEIDPGYFEVVGLELLRGRDFDVSGGEGAAPVAIVRETMSEALWPEGGALGRCLMVGPDPEACTTVVGVVEDAARSGLQDDPCMGYYMPLAQRGAEADGLHIRRSGEVEAVAARFLRSFHPQVRIARTSTLRAQLDPQSRSWSLGAMMFTIFGLLAPIVASVGLYSLLSFDVADRTRELGIRSALRVAWVGGPRVGDLLFEVSPRDPLVPAGVVVTLLVVAGLASFLPGPKATRIDPMVSIRSE